LGNAPHPPVLIGETSIIGYYPGITLTAKGQTPVPTGSVEIEVVAIRDGKLIMAECKDSGKHLTDKEAIRLAELANRLGCSRLLFVTPTSFPQIATIMRARVFGRPS
jgi:hypothetical protein